MPKNAHRYEWRIIDGKRVLVPIPFDCACGLPANYGEHDIWHCVFCWVKLKT